VDNIFLVAVAKTEHIRLFGVEDLLDNFLTTLDTLAVGLPIQITPAFPHMFFGFLVGLLGDTPATHWMLGFKESVGPAFRGCRDCFATDIERQFLVPFFFLFSFFPFFFSFFLFFFPSL